MVAAVRAGGSSGVGVADYFAGAGIADIDPHPFNFAFPPFVVPRADPAHLIRQLVCQLSIMVSERFDVELGVAVGAFQLLYRAVKFHRSAAIRTFIFVYVGIRTIQLSQLLCKKIIGASRVVSTVDFNVYGIIRAVARIAVLSLAGCIEIDNSGIFDGFDRKIFPVVRHRNPVLVSVGGVGFVDYINYGDGSQLQIPAVYISAVINADIVFV
jgi:hypothetical protein